MVSNETLLSFPDWKIPFIVNNVAYDKQLGDVIIKNNKPLAFFSRKLSKTQRNYTTTEKELIVIVECINKFCGIIFGYEMNVFSYHKIWSMLQH